MPPFINDPGDESMNLHFVVLDASFPMIEGLERAMGLSIEMPRLTIELTGAERLAKSRFMTKTQQGQEIPGGSPSGERDIMPPRFLCE